MIPIDKKSLIQNCSARTGYTQKIISEVYDYIWDIYKTELLQGNPLSISGFGNLQAVERKSKNHKHPITGDYIEGKNYKTVSFSPSPSFKDQLNKSQISQSKKTDF